MVGSEPTLDTVSVNVFVEPTTKVPLWVLAMARSIDAGTLTGTVTLPVSFPLLASPVVATVAAFSTFGAAELPTATVSVITGSDAPWATGPAVVQLTAPVACEHATPARPRRRR